LSLSLSKATRDGRFAPAVGRLARKPPISTNSLTYITISVKCSADGCGRRQAFAFPLPHMWPVRAAARSHAMKDLVGGFTPHGGGLSESVRRQSLCAPKRVEPERSKA